MTDEASPKSRRARANGYLVIFLVFVLILVLIQTRVFGLAAPGDPTEAKAFIFSCAEWRERNETVFGRLRSAGDQPTRSPMTERDCHSEVRDTLGMALVRVDIEIRSFPLDTDPGALDAGRRGAMASACAGAEIKAVTGQFDDLVCVREAATTTVVWSGVYNAMTLVIQVDHASPSTVTALAVTATDLGNGVFAAI